MWYQLTQGSKVEVCRGGGMDASYAEKSGHHRMWCRVVDIGFPKPISKSLKVELEVNRAMSFIASVKEQDCLPPTTVGVIQ